MHEDAPESVEVIESFDPLDRSSRFGLDGFVIDDVYVVDGEKVSLLRRLTFLPELSPPHIVIATLALARISRVESLLPLKNAQIRRCVFSTTNVVASVNTDQSHYFPASNFLKESTGPDGLLRHR